MSESLVGLIVSATRQKAGRLAAACAAPGLPPGCANLPAATSVAELTVVFGSFSEAASCSHFAAETDCARASTEKPSNRTPTTAITVLIVISRAARGPRQVGRHVPDGTSYTAPSTGLHPELACVGDVGDGCS